MTTLTVNTKLMKLLPTELRDYIFELCGYHKYRNGKYMRQLDKTNPIIPRLLAMPPNENGFLELPIPFYPKPLLPLSQIIYHKKIKITVIMYTVYDEEQIIKLYECCWHNSRKPNKIITIEKQYLMV